MHKLLVLYNPSKAQAHCKSHSALEHSVGRNFLRRTSVHSVEKCSGGDFTFVPYAVS
jgi:hypothetical protein